MSRPRHQVVELAAAPTAAADDVISQVAAIAVALALQTRQARPVLAAAPAGMAVAAMLPLPWQRWPMSMMRRSPAR